MSARRQSSALASLLSVLILCHHSSRKSARLPWGHTCVQIEVLRKGHVGQRLRPREVPKAPPEMPVRVFSTPN
jgi:hypothetical protein